MKTDPRIDRYIDQAAEFAQPILRHLRKIVHEVCPEAEETMKWSRPSFIYHGQILCGLSAFKAHAAFGFWHQEMEKVLAADGLKFEGAAGHFGPLTTLQDLPGDKTLRRYLKTAMELLDSGGRARPVTKPKPALPVPPDLSAALKKSPKASAAWQKFAPSHRREYIEWITEAKREETRATRLATTVEWLIEGKSRNWKYQNC